MTNPPDDAQPSSTSSRMIEGTGDFASTVIHTASGVFEDFIHSAGRLGSTAVTEALNVVGSLTAGMGTVLRGQRPAPTKKQDDA